MQEVTMNETPLCGQHDAEHGEDSSVESPRQSTGGTIFSVVSSWTAGNPGR